MIASSNLWAFIGHLPLGFHGLFGGVAILGDKVAGIAGEHHIVNFALATRAEFDHFPDIRKMVGNVVARHLAGGFGF